MHEADKKTMIKFWPFNSLFYYLQRIRPDRSRRGFALVEVLVSLAIVGVISLGFVAAFFSAGKARLMIDVRTNALNLAKSQMEIIKATTYVRAPSDGVANYTGDMVNPLPTDYQICTLNRNGEQVSGCIYGVPWDVSTNLVYIGTSPIDPGIQKVTVIVIFDTSEVLRITDLKGNN